MLKKLIRAYLTRLLHKGAQEVEDVEDLLVDVLSSKLNVRDILTDITISLRSRGATDADLFLALNHALKEIDP